MPRIALVTDSTCDLPVELIKQYNIHVVPLSVIFGTDVYLDGVTMKAEQFFEMLRLSPHHPSTSQPAPGDFAKVYDRLVGTYDHIISIHLSSGLSGTYESALLAREMYPEADIRVIDTKSASIGLGWVVLLAARAILAGSSPEQVVRIAERASAKQRIMLTVESLDWLYKNGRIGRASAFLGNLLNVKPILQVDEGVVAPFDKVRGKPEKVIARMVEAMKQFVDPGYPVYLGVVHAERPELAQRAVELVKEAYQVAEEVVCSFGPVIGVNTGPGSIGFVTIPTKVIEEEA